MNTNRDETRQAVGVLACLRDAAFELRTVTTGRDGQVANACDAAAAAVAELIAAATEFCAKPSQTYTGTRPRMVAALAACGVQS